MRDQTSRWFIYYLLIVLVVLAMGSGMAYLLRPANNVWIAGAAPAASNGWGGFLIMAGMMAALVVMLALVKSSRES